MRIAYVILAHHQPHHLARLIGMLDAPECAFFVHIDGKADATLYEQSVGPNYDAKFIKQRFVVNWGGYNLVAATLALLSEAVKVDPPIQRFCLLSGSDLPIKTNGQIIAELGTAKEFMRVDRMLDQNSGEQHTRYVTAHWFVDHSEPALKNLSGRLPRQPYARLPLYHGSQWWALTRPCVEYILRFVSSNPEYCSFFKTTLCPDEVFFHSIVKNSPFASRITHDFETAKDRTEYFLSNEHGSHYIDWNTPACPLPKVLDMTDLGRLHNSKCLFARKFDEHRSATLIAHLESPLSVPVRPPEPRPSSP